MTLTGGMGDLAKDKFNLFGTFDFYKRELLQQSDTEYLHTRDLRGEQGGRNFQSLTGGGTWRQLTAAGALTNNQRAITDLSRHGHDQPAGCGRRLAGRDFARSTSPAIRSAPGTSTPSSRRCRRRNGTAFISRATMDFTPTLQGYAELGLSRVNTFQSFQSAFFAGTTGLEQTAAGLRPYTYNINFAPGASATRSTRWHATRAS
jgi:iron complex outermembrane receptor protein